MQYFAKGGISEVLGYYELKEGLFSAFDKLGSRKGVLAIPPDFTRFHSGAGELTTLAYEYYKERLTDILPALGTHFRMTEREIKKMYVGVPLNLFRVHNWRHDLHTLGDVPSEFIHEVSEGKLNYSWPAQVNKLLQHGGHDLILSIGQVDRKSTRLNSSHANISYAVFCLK